MQHRSQQPGEHIRWHGARGWVVGRCNGTARRLIAALLVFGGAVEAVRAGEVPTASANAEAVAFAGAAEFAASPQSLLYADTTGEAALRSRPLSYLARKFAQRFINDFQRSLRESSAEQSKPRTAPRIRSHYDLRLSDDKFVVRMKYRF